MEERELKPLLILSDKIVVTTDKYNFILNVLTEVNGRDGSKKEKWKEDGYFGSLDDLLKYVLKEKIREQSDMEINELIQVIKDTEKRLVEAVMQSNIKLNK